MKRADITAGTEYGASGSNDWAGQGNGTYRACRRVRVLDVGKWANGSYYHRSSGAKTVTLADGSRVVTASFRTSDGPGVLVQPMNSDGGFDGNPIAMATREIRAPWAEVKASMDAVDAAAEERADQAKAEQNQAYELHALILSKIAAVDPYLAEELPKPERKGYGVTRFVYVVDVGLLAGILKAAEGEQS